jgi:hypothetical protein
MTARTFTVHRARVRLDPLLLAAPAAALATGMAAEWLDFRALRYPILALMFVAVLATAWAATTGHGRLRIAVIAIGVGIAAWAAAETVYVVLHAARGEEFGFDRFDSQPARALGLIAVHALFLGVPTGVAAALALQLLWLRR